MEKHTQQRRANLPSPPKQTSRRRMNMEDYSFEITSDGPCLIAMFCGHIATQRYSEFRNDYNEVCRQLIQMPRQLLVIDLTKADYFGSLFIGMIVKLTVSVSGQEGNVALCGLSDQLKELLKKLLLLERSPDSKLHLRHFATRDEAVAALSNFDG